MKIGECYTAKQLEKLGYKYILNYGGWQLWGKKEARIYVDPIFGKVSQIFEHGEKRLEVNDE